MMCIQFAGKKSCDSRLTDFGQDLQQFQEEKLHEQL